MSKILIFDSGVGGLSIYQSIKSKLPDEDFIYLFDDAYFPYGELEPEILIARVVQLMTCMHERYNPDIVVIACNSASTLVLPILRSIFKTPFVGVVPAIKPAAQITKTKTIGLLATPGTVTREYTQQLIDDHAKHCQVDMIGSTELVLQAENKLRGHLVEKDKIETAIQRWTSGYSNIDVVILGCTHFPFLQEEISACLKEGIEVIDSGEAIASRVEVLLKDIEANTDRNSVPNVFYTKKEDKKKLAQLFENIGLSQPVYLEIN